MEDTLHGLQKNEKLIMFVKEN